VELTMDEITEAV